MAAVRRTSTTGGGWGSVNWTGGIPPVSADTVTLAQPGTITITHSIGTDAVASLTGSDLLSVTGGSLAVTGTTSLTGGLSINTATLTLGGISQIAGGFAFGSGHLVVSGSTTVSGTATVGNGTIDGTGTLTTTGTTTTGGQSFLSGGMTWLNQGVLAVTNQLVLGSSTTSANLINAATGTLQLGYNIDAVRTYSNTISGQQVETVHGTLSNAGLLQVTGSNSYIGTVLNESGTMSLGANSINLAGGGSLGGNVTGTGTIYLEGGAFSLNGPTVASVAHLVLAGGTINVAVGQTLSSLDVRDGTIDGAGTLATSGATTSNFSNITLGGGMTWNNSTSFTMYNSSLKDATGSATFNNLASGTLTLNGSISSGTFVNAGLINVGNSVNRGGGLSVINAALFSSGTISKRARSRSPLARSSPSAATHRSPPPRTRRPAS